MRNKIVPCKKCGESKPHEARGLCRRCYAKARRDANIHLYPLTDSTRGRSVIICKTCGEKRKLEAKGMCRNCYARQNHNKNKHKENLIECRFCKQEKNHCSKGLCKACYSRQWRNDGELMSPRRPKARSFKTAYCETCGVFGRVIGKDGNFCKKCYDKHYKLVNKEKQDIYNNTRKSLPEVKAMHLMHKRIRRSRVRNLPSTLTEDEWSGIVLRYNHCCAYCGKYTEKPHREHWIPLSKGGGYTAENIVPACRPCNQRKGTMTGEEYIAILRKENT